MQLDYTTFQYLQNNGVTSYKDWYAKSYEIFTAQPLETINDFWKIVAFAYSWMPTIPRIHYDKLDIPVDRLMDKLQALKKGKAEQIPFLFELLVPVINNSVVGTSKVLHFIAPKIVPIYDSKVAAAWDCLFFDKNLSLANEKGDIKKVLFYVKKMQEWQANCQKECPNKPIDLRTIELALFQYATKKSNTKV